MSPGLTGPWDLARSEVESSLLDDLAYIRTYTVWADIRLMLRSLRRTVMRESAVPAMRELPGTPRVHGG
jgi:lipopolysaccharide/colanic/teichoic acid biosynthesis glycosyltransferase